MIYRIILRLHALLLHLYPRGFYEQFGSEMQEVFRQALIPARSRDSLAKLLRLFFREIWDLPGSLIRQHWLAFVEVMSMTTDINSLPASSGAGPARPGTRREAFAAGLPHLVMGMLIAGGKFFPTVSQSIPQGAWAVLGAVLSLIVIAVLITSWRRNWPLWSASWYLYGTWITLAVLGLLIENLNLQDSWRYTNALFLGWLLLCVLGYFAILFKSRLHGLLSIAFLFPMLGILILEFVPNPIEGFLALGLGLLTALSTGAIILRGKWPFALKTVLSVNILAGLFLAYLGEYQVTELPNGVTPTPEFTSFLAALAFYTAIGIGAILLPFALQSLSRLKRR